MLLKQNFTRNQKHALWGNGEWLDEPDDLFFGHCGVACEIFRTSDGFFVGTCKLPHDHPWGSTELVKADVDIHGNKFIYKTIIYDYIGFSCDMAGDFLPVWSKNDKLVKQMADAAGKSDDLIYYGMIYRNLEFATGQCRYLAEQVIEAHEPKFKSRLVK